MKKHISRLILLLSTLAVPGLRSSLSTHKSSLPPVLPIAIIGSGPAGYTAALYGARSGVPTTLISGSLPGGLLTQTSLVENFPGVATVKGPRLMETMKQQVLESGAHILDDEVISVDLSTWPFTIGLESGALYRVLSLVIATGATPKKLGIPGEDTYWGRGVSSCALCDAPFFKGKDVFVVGGGDSAIEEVTQLAPHAKSVTLLVRKPSLRAASPMKDKLSRYPNVKPIQYFKEVVQVLGNGTEVTGIEVLDHKTNKKGVIPADGLFLAIGHNPNTYLFEKQLSLSDSGHIIVLGRSQNTSIPGVFAAGDVEDQDYRQAVVAAGRGCAAVLDAVRWLQFEKGFTW